MNWVERFPMPDPSTCPQEQDANGACEFTVEPPTVTPPTCGHKECCGEIESPECQGLCFGVCGSDLDFPTEGEKCFSLRGCARGLTCQREDDSVVEPTSETGSGYDGVGILPEKPFPFPSEEEDGSGDNEEGTGEDEAFYGICVSTSTVTCECCTGNPMSDYCAANVCSMVKCPRLECDTDKNIDIWLSSNKDTLNMFGDSSDMMYTGGTPLFNERTGETVSLYAYIRSQHSDKPWCTTTTTPSTTPFLPGGQTKIDLSDKNAMNAAIFALTQWNLKEATNNNGVKFSVSQLISGTQQVVAGIKYSLRFEAVPVCPRPSSAATNVCANLRVLTFDAVIVVQSWLSTPYSVVSLAVLPALTPVSTSTPDVTPTEGPLPGGHSKVDLTDKSVIAAVSYAFDQWTAKQSASNANGVKFVLGSLISGTQQVVAGIKYSIRFSANPSCGRSMSAIDVMCAKTSPITFDLVIVVQSWMPTPYNVLSLTVVSPIVTSPTMTTTTTTMKKVTSPTAVRTRATTTTTAPAQTPADGDAMVINSFQIQNVEFSLISASDVQTALVVYLSLSDSSQVSIISITALAARRRNGMGAVVVYSVTVPEADLDAFMPLLNGMTSSATFVETLQQTSDALSSASVADNNMDVAIFRSSEKNGGSSSSSSSSVTYIVIGVVGGVLVVGLIIAGVIVYTRRQTAPTHVAERDAIDNPTYALSPALNSKALLQQPADDLYV